MGTYLRYFKFRDRFDFSPHRYATGRAVLQSRSLEDNFFVLKICQLDPSEYGPFYNYHLEHYLPANPSGEEVFFKHVYDIVVTRIRHFKRQDPFSSQYALRLENTRKLEALSITSRKTSTTYWKEACNEPQSAITGTG